MYRCQLCKAPSKPRQPRLTHLLTRSLSYFRRGTDGIKEEANRTEIAKEISVCRRCKGLLENGSTVERLARLRRPGKVINGDGQVVEEE